jgi:uncharacterized protein (DUF433 family)
MAMEAKTQFTAGEAAFVLREPIRAVKKALDRGPVRPVLQSRSGSPVRVILWADLFYLFAVRVLAEDLTPKARTELYEAVQRAQSSCGDEVRFGRFRIAVADLVDEVKKRVAELAELHNKVARAANGKAVLDARGVEVHRIAALLRGGLSVDAVVEEYPFLSHDAVETARAYAQAFPRPGRPYPRTTAARARREAGLELPEEVPFDDSDDD